MTAPDPQPAESKAKRRWFRFSPWKLLIFTMLFAVTAFGLTLWRSGLPLSWTADYDRVRYARIRRAIDADPRHLVGKRFDEVAAAFGLEGVPWDDAATQQPAGMLRMYHFQGFVLYVSLTLLPAGVTPGERWNATDSGRSTPATEGRLKTSHFEESRIRRLGSKGNLFSREPYHAESAQSGHDRNHLVPASQTLVPAQDRT